MKQWARGAMRYLPLLLGLGILAVAIPLVPWSKVLPYLGRLTPATLLALAALSAVYYAGRAVRYWLMLRLLGERASFGQVAMACLVAQPVAVLPGGELYRSAMLKRYANVARRVTIPSVLAQSMAEYVGLLAIAFAGVLMLHRYGRILVGLAVVFAGIWAVVRWQRSRASHRLVNRLPWVDVSYGHVRSFFDKNRALLGGWNFVRLLAASGITIAAGCGVMAVTSHVVGADLTLMEAAVAYALPALLEAVTFLPGGLGVNEQGTVGVLAIMGVALPEAVAMTLIVRMFTLGAGFVYGFGAMGLDRLLRYRHFD
jgi:uncharacterized membrane protein YbhN (UPF0104 family)